MTQSGRGVFSPGKGVFFLDEMVSFWRDCRFYSPVWMRWWVKVTSANTMSGPWTRKGKFANQTQVFEILVKFEIRLKALEENANLNIRVEIFSYDLLQAWMSILKPSMQIYKWTDGTTQAECIWILNTSSYAQNLRNHRCAAVHREICGKNLKFKINRLQKIFFYIMKFQRIERIRRANFKLKLKSA